MRPHESKALKSIARDLLSALSSFEEQIRAIANTEEAQRQAQEQIPAHLAALRVNENEKRENRSYRGKNFAVQVILAIGTWGACIGALIYASIAARTLNQVKNQAEAAQSAALTAAVALMQSQNEFQQDQRAWIGIDQVSLGVPRVHFGGIPDGRIIPVPETLHIRNDGKTPALDVRGCVRKPQTVRGHERPKCGCTAPESIGNITPNESAEIYRKFDMPNTPEFSSAVAGKEAHFVITGMISYNDVWRSIRHTTNFCFIESETLGQFNPCGFCGGAD